MSLKKFVIIPLIIAVLAFAIQVLDNLVAPCMPLENKGLSWICFQSWAVYFFAGGTVKGGIKSLIGYAIGIVISIAIISWGTASFMSPFGSFAVPIAVGIVAGLVIFLERNDWTSSVPAIFIGAGAFFAFMNYVVPEDLTLTVCEQFRIAAITEIIYCFIGLAFGFITVTLRVMYENKVNKKQ
ncbi:MAG: DUF1097 domain-containing protein [Prevotellaceae bacterium]|jgi:hypothetical protein|nr:DUF1097 domain-containing protein [Prevotellaceae bacterium]